MYAGHLGLGLVAKSRRDDVPVAAFLAASVATDLLVLSVFHTVPLVAATAAMAFAVGAIRWDRVVGGLFALLVGAHWLVDLVTSSLPLWPNGPKVGLRAYDVPPVDLGLELVVIAAGWWLWRNSLPDGQAARVRPMLYMLVISQLFFDLFIAGNANG